MKKIKLYSVIDYIGEISLDQLFNRQRKIFERYDSVENSFPISDPKTFIKSLDAYILHAIEEVYEFYETSFTDKEELIDLFNYLLTIGSIFHKITGSVPDVDFVDEITYSSKVNVNAILHEINAKLITMRRLFPERKWHIAHDDSTVDFDRIEKSQRLIVEAVYGVFLLSSILPYFNLTPKELTNKSEAKVQKILQNSPKDSKRD